MNLGILPVDMERSAKAVDMDLARLKKIQTEVEKDLDRIQQLLDQREVENFKSK